MWPGRWGGSCNRSIAASPRPMTNRIAIALILMAVAFLVADAVALHLGAGLFLARQFTLLVDSLAFWR